MVSLFADDMLLYRENPKDVIKKLLELINEFNKVLVHKINTQKPLAFLYANKDQKNKLRKQSHIPSHKRIKYLGLKLPTEAILDC